MRVQIWGKFALTAVQIALGFASCDFPVAMQILNRWLVLHGKKKSALAVLKKIYNTQELAESYLDKIKSNANALSLREQFKLIWKWSVIQRCERKVLSGRKM